jgi:hypothetical protein
MAKQRAQAHEASRAVTTERARRLIRLVQILAAAPQTRLELQRRLRIDVRSFYRDLELLRSSGLAVPFAGRRYHLEGNEQDAIAALPFPDPRLRLGEVIQLSRGRTAAHDKLRAMIQEITRTTPRKRGATPEP